MNYIKNYNMGDYNIIMDTDDIIHQAFLAVLDDKAELEKKSRYHTNDRVHMTKHINAIVDCLMPTYTRHDATMIARGLAGQEVLITGVDELVDRHNKKVICYTIEDEFNLMYVFPEYLFTSEEERDCSKCYEL